MGGLNLGFPLRGWLPIGWKGYDDNAGLTRTVRWPVDRAVHKSDGQIRVLTGYESPSQNIDYLSSYTDPPLRGSSGDGSGTAHFFSEGIRSRAYP